MAEISLQAYLQKIDEAIAQGGYDEALAHGRHILQHYPKYLPVYRLLGKAMVEAGRHDLAEDMFLRVLSGDPEDFVARVGMSIIADHRGDLQRAIWHMERAFELEPNNDAIQDELRKLYSRRDGVEPPRLHLTRAGLARLYLRGNLLSRAVEELRALVAEEPGRIDLWVALAEACWRNDQRVQAEEACLHVLEELPYCLKANLILGEIWARSGREEGRVHLERAEALDPEHQEAVRLLGDSSPLEPREIRLPRLEYVLPEAAERPAWMVAAEAEGGMAGAERGLVDLETGMGIQIEIPSWLEELGAGEEEEVEGLPEEAMPRGEEVIEVPERPFGRPVGVEMAKGPEEEAPALEEEPEWLRGLEEAEWGEQLPPETAEEGGALEFPDWLAGTGAVEEEAGWPPAEPPVPAEIPEWLREMAPPGLGEVEEEAPPGWPEEELQPLPEEEEGEIPDWLMEAASLPPVGPEVEVPLPEESLLPEEEGEVPDWLKEAAAMPPVEPEVEAPPPEEKGGAAPSWLEGEGLPSGDEALAWLESLVAGKEEELRAAAEAEAEARMAEIMGRPREAAPPVKEAAPPAEERVEAFPPYLEEAGPHEGELELEELEEVAAPEWLIAAAAPEPAPPPRPAIPEELPGPEELSPPEVPRAEVLPAEPEAFGWTAFGVEEAPSEPAPPEAARPVEEGFGWIEFEAEPSPPQVELAAEVPPLEETLVQTRVERRPWEPKPPRGEAVPPPIVEVPLPEGVESLRGYVRAHPRDYQARLALAREMWRAGLYADSLEVYSQLLRSGKQVDEVMADMEAYVEERPSDPAVRRVLGDAYMRVGRLEEALEVYREALESL